MNKLKLNIIKEMFVLFVVFIYFVTVLRPIFFSLFCPSDLLYAIEWVDCPLFHQSYITRLCIVPKLQVVKMRKSEGIILCL